MSQRAIVCGLSTEDKTRYFAHLEFSNGDRGRFEVDRAVYDTLAHGALVLVADDLSPLDSGRRIAIVVPKP